MKQSANWMADQLAKEGMMQPSLVFLSNGYWGLVLFGVFCFVMVCFVSGVLLVALLYISCTILLL